MGRNIDVEDRAIQLVMEYEKACEPRDVRKTGVGFDVECSDKIIEVKRSTEKTLPFVTLNSGNLKALEHHKNFFVYVVYDLDGCPKLVKLDKAFILKEGKEKLSIEVPLRREQFGQAVILDT